MKKLVLVAAVAVFGLTANAQVGFGVTAGYLNGNFQVEIAGAEGSTSESGFYAGAFAEFQDVAEHMSIEAGLNYASITAEGSDNSNHLMLPILVKYYLLEMDGGLYLQAGPQLMYNLEDVGEDGTPLNISLALGVGYDITENFFVQARYAAQLNNYYTGDNDDNSLKMNTITAGVGYKF